MAALLPCLSFGENTLVLCSVIIPTNRDPAVLEACLKALAAQDLPASAFEVLVCCNGVRPLPPTNHEWPFRLVCLHHPAAHIGVAKNLGLEHARGEFVVLLNDDVRPRTDFLRRHVTAHHRRDEPCQVLGLAEWQRGECETLFDRMVRTTSMIFFYDQLRPHRFYNYRHAWHLNLSIPARLLQTERFDERLGPLFLEDLELAYRLEAKFGARVWFAPEAHAVHEHTFTQEGYFAREESLGRAAVRLWRANPDCFFDLYRATPTELRDSYEHYVTLEQRCAPARYERFQRAAIRRVADCAQDPLPLVDLVNLLYDAHLPLKRLAFRRGFLDGLSENADTRPRTAQPVELY